jgi:gliding motility-associated-like protein
MTAFSNKEYVCLFDTLSFISTLQGGVQPYTFKWRTDNAAAVFNDNVLNGVTPGKVSISMTATDKKQCNYDYNNIKPIEIKSIPTAILKAKDTVVCNQDPITLQSAGNFLFSWLLNGRILYSSTVDTFSTALPGFYKLKVNDGKCNSLLSDSIFIKQLVVPNYTLKYNPTICINTPLAINTNAQDAKNIYFKWDFGDMQTYDKAQPMKHLYQMAGNYIIKLTVTNDYCPKYEQFLKGDSIKVVLPVSPSNFTLFVLSEIDTLFKPFKYDSGYNIFQWYPSTFLSNSTIPNPIFNGNRSINYILTRTDSTTACKVDDLYKIDVSNDVIVGIPKAFSPNGDNLNDILRIQYGAGLKTFNFLKIFNRWGNLVFMSTNVNQGWDGTYNGVPQEMDAYTYFMSYITFKNEPVSKTGSFILLR